MSFVIMDVKECTDAEDCPNGVVANMSLGGRKLQAMNDAVSGQFAAFTTDTLTLIQASAIVASSIFLSVAAGNEAMPGDYTSPASEPTAYTVGATAINGTLIEWSNHGTVIDILVPHVNITGTWIGGGTETISGIVSNFPDRRAYVTCADILHRLQSMATPHVVGHTEPFGL
jgi:hypothetical protein